jgi:hypothetical protein
LLIGALLDDLGKKTLILLTSNIPRLTPGKVIKSLFSSFRIKLFVKLYTAGIDIKSTPKRDIKLVRRKVAITFNNGKRPSL